MVGSTSIRISWGRSSANRHAPSLGVVAPPAAFNQAMGGAGYGYSGGYGDPSSAYGATPYATAPGDPYGATASTARLQCLCLGIVPSLRPYAAQFCVRLSSVSFLLAYPSRVILSLTFALLYVIARETSEKSHFYYYCDPIIVYKHIVLLLLYQEGRMWCLGSARGGGDRKSRSSALCVR